MVYNFFSLILPKYFLYTGSVQKAKGAKNVKKNAGKGKKKSANQKTDVAQTLEANGPLDKSKVINNFIIDTV